MQLFDRMERGEVEEGPSLREQVELVQMHRWGGQCGTGPSLHFWSNAARIPPGIAYNNLRMKNHGAPGDCKLCTAEGPMVSFLCGCECGADKEPPECGGGRKQG